MLLYEREARESRHLQHNTPFSFLARSGAGWRLNLDLMILGQQTCINGSEEDETTEESIIPLISYGS
jgi:hypothetical protein